MKVFDENSPGFVSYSVLQWTPNGQNDSFSAASKGYKPDDE